MYQPGLSTDDALRQELRAVFQGGDIRRSVEIAEQILRRAPNDFLSLQVVGACHVAMGSWGPAIAALERAKGHPQAGPPLYQNLASAYRGADRFDEAFATVDEMIARWPDDVTGVATRADLHYYLGQTSQAVALLDEWVHQRPDDFALALSYGKAAVRGGDPARAVALLEPHMARADLPPAMQTQAMFVLGHLNDKLKRHDQAFRWFVRANRAQPVRHDPAEVSRLFDAMIAGWTPQAMRDAGDSGIQTQVPVLIVGMPRSGTSLTEQIIDTHPLCHGAGELSDLGFIIAGSTRGQEVTDPRQLPSGATRRLAERYLAVLRTHSDSAQRVTDKLPLNFYRAGLFALMYPQGRIIHCCRDPLDTCLSCFFVNFETRLSFTYSLEHLGAFYRDYQRLMRHWHEVLPGRILDVEYEAMVADMEGQSRRLIEFLGLPWDDACLEFHRNQRVTRTASNDQVRRPIYTSSVKRHTPYEAWLGPLKRAIAGPPRGG